MKTQERFNILLNNWHLIEHFFLSNHYEKIEENIQQSNILRFHYRNNFLKKDAFIQYITIDANNVEVDCFFGFFSNEGSLDIDFGKYLLKNSITKEDCIKVRYNSFDSFENGLIHALQILNQTLNSSPLKGYLTTAEWTDAYYKPWYEGTGL